MTDEIFFKRAKEAIVEHFNFHCKVGDMFEDEVPTTEEFICPMWCSMGSTSDIRKAMFCVESSGIYRIYYSVTAIPEKTEMRFEILKAIGFDIKDIDKKDANANMYVVSYKETEKKVCESHYVKLHKSKGKDEPSDDIVQI